MILLIAIVLGALVGAAASGEGGALAGALFGWLIVRSLRQQREIEALRKRADAPVSAAAWRDARSERESIEQGLDGATPSTAAASNGGVTPGAGGRGAVLANDIAPIAAAVASTSASAIAPARASAYAPTSATAVAPSSAAAALNTVSGTPAGVANETPWAGLPSGETTIWTGVSMEPVSGFQCRRQMPPGTGGTSVPTSDT